MEQQNKTAPDKWLVFFLVAVGVFMSTLDGSIVNIALSAIMHDLDAPLSTVEWVMMIYLLTVSSLLLSFGRLSDIKGRRWVYSRGLLVFSLGSLFCGTARNAVWLIAARSFQGMGAAMIMSCTPALVMNAFPASERGKSMGMVGAVVASGLTIGPALGGMILHFFSWQAIFYINIPIGVITAVIVDRLLKGSLTDVSRGESFDWQGAVLLIFSLGPLLLVITHGYDWGYSSPRILCLAGISAISAAGFFRLESRVTHPIFSLSLLKIRLFTIPLIAAMILFLSLFVMIFLMPFYLMHPCGFSVSQTGSIMVTPFVFLFALSPISGTLSDRIGSRALCTVGMGLLTLALFLLSRISPFYTAFPIVWRLALAGIGTAIFTAPNSATVMSSVPPKHLGVAAGTVATARNLGMVLGIALSGTIFNYTFYRLSGGLNLKVYQPEMEAIFMTAFRYAMLAGALSGGIGTVLAFLRGEDKEVRNEKLGVRREK